MPKSPLPTHSGQRASKGLSTCTRHEASIPLLGIKMIAQLRERFSRQQPRDRHEYSSIEGLEPTTITNHDCNGATTNCSPKIIHPAGTQDLRSEDFIEAETSLKRKLDMRLLACVWLMFILNFLDRVCPLSWAGLSANAYNTP